MSSNKIGGIKTVFTFIFSGLLFISAAVKTFTHVRSGKILDNVKNIGRSYDNISSEVKLVGKVLSKRHITMAGDVLTLEIPKNFKSVGDNWKFWKRNRQFEDPEKNIVFTYMSAQPPSGNYLLQWKQIHDGIELIEVCADITSDNQFVTDNKLKLAVKNVSYAYLENNDTTHGYSYYIMDWPTSYIIAFESEKKDSLQQISQQYFHEFLSVQGKESTNF